MGEWYIYNNKKSLNGYWVQALRVTHRYEISLRLWASQTFAKNNTRLFTHATFVARIWKFANIYFRIVKYYLPSTQIACLAPDDRNFAPDESLLRWNFDF